MGQTLENGIYLPSEGERNCYDGLASNWRSVDTNIGYISALRQAIAGALTRKIVTELPTEDIDPNCIYMILKTTPQTNNVYNEWMYISNAWELIGDTQLDLSDYYTKQEVNQLPAVASGVTSTKVGNYDAHIANGDIHVTASDKTKWNTVALIKQLRLVNAQVGSATTIAFANIDDTNGIKTGDKCMDLDAKMFEITAVDTANQTVTVGTALVDLALNANVVHTSGNETIGGIKNFTNDTYVKNINFTKEVASTSASTTSVLQLINTVTYTDQTADKVAILNFRVTADGVKAFYPNENNQYSLGLQSRKWSEVRAIQYYYGSSDTEFSQKFVTTDTAQTIAGLKNFTNYITSDGDYLGNEASVNQRTNFLLRSNRDTAGKSGIYITKFRQNRAQGELQPLDLQKIGFDVLENEVRTNNVFDIQVTGWSVNVPTQVKIVSSITNYSFGSSYYPCKINELEPSALSMPDLSNGVDISSYITIGNTDDNYYTPSVNGWIWAKMLGNGLAIQQGDFGSYGNYVADSTTGDKYVEACLLVTKNVQATIRCRGITGIVSAKFYPCQGNV